MPALGPSDPLPRRPQRVLVGGTSGSGKTTLAAQIAAIMDIPQVEIDALFHGQGWLERPSFLPDVRRFVAEPEWVTEWQYPAARPILAERADLLVWLDLPRPVVLGRVIRRTVRRRWRREVLWNGNLEPPLRTIFTQRGHIVRWAWTTHGQQAERVRMLSESRPELVIVRLRRVRDGDYWVRHPLAWCAGAG